MVILEYNIRGAKVNYKKGSLECIQGAVEKLAVDTGIRILGGGDAALDKVFVVLFGHRLSELGGTFLFAVPTVSLPLRSLLGCRFLRRRELGGLDLGVAAGGLDRVRHFDLALGIAAEDDVFELGSVLGGDDGLDADLQILIGDAVPNRAEVVPHGRFRLDGGIDGRTDLDGQGGDNGDVVLRHFL